MALFIASNIHQGDEIFSVQSRGRQCALKAMSLSALSFGFIVLLFWPTTHAILTCWIEIYFYVKKNGCYKIIGIYYIMFV